MTKSQKSPLERIANALERIARSQDALVRGNTALVDLLRDSTFTFTAGGVRFRGFRISDIGED